MNLQKTIRSIQPLDKTAMEQAARRWDSIAKPLHSLGLLEETIIRAAGMQRTSRVSFSPRALLVFCADNGVVAQGVTQTDQSVTAIVTENFTKGKTSSCVMAEKAGVDLIPVDIGVSKPMEVPVFYRKKSGWEPMISLWDLLCAGRRRSGRWKPAFAWRGSWQMRDTVPLPQVKWELATPLPARRWYRCCWDMIRPKLPAWARAFPPRALVRKVETIRRGIAVNRPNPDDALDVLSKVGGLDLAGIAGAFLGGASAGIPVVIDGLISAAAALIAVRCVRLAPSTCWPLTYRLNLPGRCCWMHWDKGPFFTQGCAWRGNRCGDLISGLGFGISGI